MTPPEQQVFGNRYEIVRHIARGGMAQVYLAKDTLLDRFVALKVLFPELATDEAFVERFRREARAAAGLTHPNIVSVFDWGQGDNTYYIVMEYIDGQTLSSLIRKGPIESKRAASIGADIAAALSFAHKHGVIHRDVKPGNVLIDENGLVKVADFGIARAVGTAEDLTQVGSVMGTANYFSPEQAQGNPVDARSDVYSLGVVLYEMVAGRAPFSGDNPVTIAYKHVKETPDPLTTLNASIPTSLAAIIDKAMTKDAAGRYQSAEDLRGDLTKFSRGEPVKIAPEAATMATRVVSTYKNNEPATSIQRSIPPTGGRDAYIPPETKRPRGYGWVWVLLIILLALGIGLFAVGDKLGWWSSKTAIPASVIGQPDAQARTILAGDGFTDITSQTEVSTKYPAGDVITTQPAPGTKVSTSSLVTLIESSGPQSVTVPDVATDSVSLATQTLQSAGLKVKQMSESSSSVPKGTVIGTEPVAGSQVSAGTTVQLIVSSGQKNVQIPNLTGQDPSSAGATLSSLGLNVAQQLNEPSNTVPSGEVTRTVPAAGSNVPVGTNVTVYVSSGPSSSTTTTTTSPSSPTTPAT